MSNGRNKLVIEVDREIGEGVLRLADYIDGNANKNEIIGKTFGLLLVSLMVDGSDTFDGFERILELMEVQDAFEKDKIYGEFLSLGFVFKKRYRHYKYLLMDLERILPNDLRVFAEEIFDVRWDRNASVLLVS